MKSRKASFLALWLALLTSPRTVRPTLGSAPSTGKSSRARLAPNTCRTTSVVECSRSVRSSAPHSVPLLHEIATPALSIAYACTTWSSFPYSSATLFIALRRVGAL